MKQGYQLPFNEYLGDEFLYIAVGSISVNNVVFPFAMVVFVFTVQLILVKIFFPNDLFRIVKKQQQQKQQ